MVSQGSQAGLILHHTSLPAMEASPGGSEGWAACQSCGQTYWQDFFSCTWKTEIPWFGWGAASDPLNHCICMTGTSKKKKKRGTTNILFACFFFRDKFSLHSWLRSQIQAVKLLQISQQNLWVPWLGPLLSPLDSIPYLSNLHLGMANYTIPSSDLWPEMQPASPCHLAGAMLPMQQRCIQPPCASCPVWSYRTKVFVVVMQEKGYRVHFVQICQKSIFKGIF